MAQTLDTTGRYGNVTVLGVVIPITGWRCKVHKEFAIATDSGNYDSATAQLWRSRAPGEVWCEGSLEGNFDLAGTTDANFIQKFKSDGPYAVVLNITRTVQFASFNGDFDEIEINVAVPGATMVTFTTPFMSNGVPTLY